MSGEFVSLNPENYHRAYQLHHKGHFTPWSERVFADCLERPYFAYQLQEQGQSIGYYLCLQVLDEATLMDITVDTSRQRQGLGQKILTHFMHQCRLREVTTIWLEVRESNVAALVLYEKAGFCLIERRANYYASEGGREDALIMCCAIAKIPSDQDGLNSHG